MTNNVKQNKRKIINDPVFGFILVPFDLLFHLIEHPYIQRLKRIKQLGLSHYVYPGAQHTRFQHILGAMHLMGEAVKTLRDKNVEISEQEEIAVLAAILLHDIGHGPFSHALENSLVPVSHEEISIVAMQQLNVEMNGQLDMAIEIFKGNHNKQFLHQLVSSQLDMDRMDYLRRDSFFTGVIEGTIGSARIIKMLNVHNDQLVLDAKGIYSIEKFLIARRLMYWQVYLHKTAVGAENMLINVLRRAKQLVKEGQPLFATPSFNHFLQSEVSCGDFNMDKEVLDQFMNLDDTDIMVSLKSWQNSSDTTLSILSKGLVNRQLYKTEISSDPFPQSYITAIRSNIQKVLGLNHEDCSYFMFQNTVSNAFSSQDDHEVNILYKDGSIAEISKASDILRSNTLEADKPKHVLCYLRT